MLGGWTDEKPRKDRTGKRWYFSYWYNGPLTEDQKAQRLAFWDDQKTECGVVLYPPGKTIPYTRIVDQINNLAASASVRKQHHRALQFPLQSHYPRFGDFPEEQLLING